jgi:hypothetical protein
MWRGQGENGYFHGAPEDWNCVAAALRSEALSVLVAPSAAAMGSTRAMPGLTADARGDADKDEATRGNQLHAVARKDDEGIESVNVKKLMSFIRFPTLSTEINDYHLKDLLESVGVDNEVYLTELNAYSTANRQEIKKLLHVLVSRIQSEDDSNRQEVISSFKSVMTDVSSIAAEYFFFLLHNHEAQYFFFFFFSAEVNHEANFIFLPARTLSPSTLSFIPARTPLLHPRSNPSTYTFSLYPFLPPIHPNHTHHPTTKRIFEFFNLEF